MLQLQLLGTVGCHLCDEAEQVLLASLDLYSVQVEVVDIAESDALFDRFGIRIPVLRHESSNTCLDWPFADAEVAHFVQGLRAE
jgi:hypothetical protein